MDPAIIDKVVNEHCNGDYDYTSNMVERTYPRGMDTEVVEYCALEKSWRSTSDKDDKEHVTLFIRRKSGSLQNPQCKKEGKQLDDLRLCLDTEEDLKLITEIYDNIYINRPIKLDEVIDFLDKNPDLRKINSNIHQKLVKGKVF